MMWIYIAVIVLSGVIAFFLFRRLSLNRVVITLMIITVMAVSFKAMYVYFVPHYRANHFAVEIRRSSPLINILAQYSPSEFNTYVDAVKQSIIGNGDPNNEIVYTGEFINLELSKYSQTANNTSLYHYLQANIDLDKKLYSINPMLVLLQEFPEKFVNRVDLNNLYTTLNPDDFKSVLVAKESVILSGIEDPQPSLRYQDVIKANLLFGEIVNQLGKQFGMDKVAAAFNNPDDPSTDEKQSAAVMIRFYENIYARGPDTAGILLKYLFKSTGVSNSMNSQALR